MKKWKITAICAAVLVVSLLVACLVIKNRYADIVFDAEFAKKS